MTTLSPNPIRTIALLGMALLLAACQSLPTPDRWSPAQREMLQANNFVETGDNWELSIGERLLFDSDQSQLLPDQDLRLQTLARRLQSVGIATARVEGHADSTGSSAHNLALSHARALAVAIPLRRGGMTLGRSKIIGRGENLPLSPNDTAEGRQDNRRVVILISPAD